MAISLDLLIMKGEGEEKEKQLEHTQTDGNEAIPRPSGKRDAPFEALLFLFILFLSFFSF